ncbi:MAG: ATP-binding protein [Planctomycetota bacterium]
MATAEQLKALIRCHAEGDDARFYAIAMQVAASEARGGHGRFAQELRELVDRAKAAVGAPRTSPSQPLAVAQPRGELAGLLTFSYPKARLSDMALSKSLAGRLERVLLEQRQRERIRQHGLAPIRKLLLIGPPGTGKTMTASALAGELAIPLFTIQLHALITKFMGETAAKLRLVFDAIHATRGVYLFDEFDALGGQRSSGHDVGEIRRVLNSFLQFLEHDASDSLLVGATNHVEILDRALFRRFDAVLEYAPPSTDIATRIMQNRLSLLDATAIDWTAAAKAADGLSHSEIVHACEHAAKNALLEQSTVVRQDDLLAALEERRRSHS